MHTPPRRAGLVGRHVLTSMLCATALGACADQHPAAPSEAQLQQPATTIQAFECAATRTSMSCAPAGLSAGGASRVIIGGQNTFLRLSSSGVIYDAGTETFSVDVTVQNLMVEAIGTPDGVTSDPDGIQVFFAGGITPTGTGEVVVANADGTGFFTAANQPYFRYNTILGQLAVSGSKTWQFQMPAAVTGFSFVVYVETDVQPLLVINEILANPGGAIADANGEWIEIYNLGTRAVDLQGLLIADSAASGRRPYHQFAGPLVIEPNGYVVLGNTTNTTDNGGVPVDYAYGAALTLANSLDAIKLSRVVGTDTLTLDRVAYAAAISAQNGISRELNSPSIDNLNVDGSNWSDAPVTAVYGGGGRGTPGAVNSALAP